MSVFWFKSFELSLSVKKVGQEPRQEGLYLMIDCSFRVTHNQSCNGKKKNQYPGV